MASNNNKLIKETNDETEKRSGLMSKIEELKDELLKDGLLNVKELCLVVFNMKYELLEKMCSTILNLTEENKKLNKKVEELEEDLEEKIDDLKDDLKKYVDNKK